MPKRYDPNVGLAILVRDLPYGWALRRVRDPDPAWLVEDEAGRVVGVGDQPENALLAAYMQASPPPER